MADLCGLSPERRREVQVQAGRAASWSRRAAEIQRLMALGCEDDIDMDLRASWDFTMRRFMKERAA